MLSWRDRLRFNQSSDTYFWQYWRAINRGSGISGEHLRSCQNNTEKKSCEMENNSDAKHETGATSEKKKIREKRKKTSDTENLKSNAMNHESDKRVPEKMEAVNLEPAGNGISGKNKSKGKNKKSGSRVVKTGDIQSTICAPTEAEATDLDCTPQKKKKKAKISNNREVVTMVSESGDLEMLSVDNPKVEASADAIGDPTIDYAPEEKKKTKKKSKRRDDARIKSKVPTKVEDAYLDCVDDVTREEKKKKEESKISDELVKMALSDKSTVLAPTESEAANLDPIADVTLRKKKKKKRVVLETEPLAYESPSLVAEEANATEALSLEPAANEKSRKMKKKSKRSNDIETATMESDSALVVSVIEKDMDFEPSDNTSAKMKKKTKRSDNLEVTTVDSKSNLLGRQGAQNAATESPVLTEATASENFAASLDSGCLENNKVKRRKKRKDRQADSSIATESNDKVCETGEVTVTKNVILDHKESIQPSAEELTEQPYPALEEGMNMVQQTKELKDSDMDCSPSLGQHMSPQRTVEAKESQEDENLAGKYEALKLTGTKEKSLVIVEECGLQNGVQASSIRQSDCSSMVNDVLGVNKAETYRSLDVGKSSGLSPIQHPEKGDVDESLSHDLMEVTPSVLVENTSSQLDDDVAKQVEKDTVSIGKPERSLVSPAKKKLLILDVNGILVDFVNYNPRPYRADITISNKYVFKRPHCDDFIRFCLERFNVGVWSSRMKQNMQKVIDFLFRDSKEKLFLCWDQSHCTTTTFMTLENQGKPLVLKELRKVWEKSESDLPFEKGEYDETNTLLLDDSPYKALRNPPNTAIFPHPYRYIYWTDNTLGPTGSLRTYLEGLSLADNVQKYIEQNPFGQLAITESHKSWSFYSKIVRTDPILLS